jgi:antitoxin component of RelBE/YafQ-DinJ toxin-antitoxin module
MSKTKSITVRLDPHLKDNAERVLGELGLTVSRALPNATTQRALNDARARRGLTRFATTDELFADLGIR